MKQIEWELLIIQIMFNGWKRPELFSKEFRMALWKIEEEGIISPVISISCEYKAINLDTTIYKTIIPRNVRLAEAPSHGLPINVYDSKSTGAESYRELAQEVIEREEYM